MKTQEEIEQLAKHYFPDPYICTGKEGFIEGYTQCQEDIRELLIEIKNNWTGDKLIGGIYEKICNSLNKQD